MLSPRRHCLTAFAALALIATPFARAQALPPASPALARTPTSPVVAGGPKDIEARFDLNQDGFPDLVTCDSDFVVRVRLATTNGEFSANTQALNFFPNNPDAVALGRLSGDDSRPDLAAVVSGGIRLFSNTGATGANPQFGTIKTLTVSGITITDLEIADLDGDGRDDIVATGTGLSSLNNPEGKVVIFLNSAAGFTTGTTLQSPGSSASRLALGDIDGNGAIDIAVVNRTEFCISVYMATSPATFPSPPVKKNVITNLEETPAAVALGQIWGTNNLEMAVWIQKENSFDPSKNTIGFNLYQHAGNGTFSFVASSAKGDHTPSFQEGDIAIADMNYDGVPDVVLTNPVLNQVVVHAIGLDTAGAQSFYGGHSTSYYFDLSNTPKRLSIANLNNDSSGGHPKLDAAVSIQPVDGDRCVDILLNGGGNVPPPNTMPVPVLTVTKRPSDYHFFAVLPKKLISTGVVSFEYSSADDPDNWFPLPDTDLAVVSKDRLKITLDTELVPDGPTYFRAVATDESATLAPGISNLIGPIDLSAIEAVEPTTSLTLKIGGKLHVTSTQQGKTFDFTAVQAAPKDAPKDLKVYIQYSFTPDDEDSWDFLDDSRMDLVSKTKTTQVYHLATSKIPTTEGQPAGQQTLYFRTLTRAVGRTPAPGPLIDGETVPVGPIAVVKGPFWRYVAYHHESSKDTSGATAYIGDTITYTIRFVNDGAAPATDVLVTLNAPKSTEIVDQTAADRDPSSTKTRAKWALASLPPNVTVTKTMTVKVNAKANTVIKMPSSNATVKCDEIGSTTATPERTELGKPLETRIFQALRLYPESIDAVTSAGGLLEYILIAENPTGDPLSNAKATFRLPYGTCVEELNSLDQASGNFTGPALANPSLQSNPSLTPYQLSLETQLITWDIGTLPANTKRKLRVVLRVQFDLPKTFTFLGKTEDAKIRVTDYSLTATTSKGAKLAAFKGAPPVLRTLISSGAPPSPAPALSVVKTATADGQLSGEPLSQANKAFKFSPAGVPEAAALEQGKRMTYTLYYQNAPNAGAGRNVTIHDEVPDGVVFTGFIRINDQLIVSSSGFAFRNKDGDDVPAPGEAFVDKNSNERWDPGEPFSDDNKNHRYDGITDIRFLDYNVGALPGGSAGKLSYEVVATAEAPKQVLSLSSGALIPKTRGGLQYEGYAISSENLLLPVAGAPKRVVAFIVPPAVFSFPVPPQLRFGSAYMPGAEITWDIPYQVTGGQGVTFQNVRLQVPVSAALDVVGSKSGFIDKSTGLLRNPAYPGQSGPPSSSAGTARIVEFQLGELPDKDPNGTIQPGLGREGIARIVFKMPANTPQSAIFDANGALKREFFIRPVLDPGSVGAPAQLRAAGRHRALGEQNNYNLISTLGVGSLQFLNVPDLCIGRTAPLSVDKGEEFSVIVYFANTSPYHGGGGGEIAMQIPYGTELVSASNTVANAILSDTGEERRFTDMAAEIDGETVRWKTRGGFAAGEAQAAIVVLRVKPDFTGNSITDKSCCITFADAYTKSATPLTIHVRQDKNIFAAFFEAIGAIFSGIFDHFSPAAQQALQGGNIDNLSRQITLAGAGHLDILNGTKIVPLGRGGRVLVVGSIFNVELGLGNEQSTDDVRYLASDGAAIVAVGYSDSPGFNIKNVPVQNQPVWTPYQVLTSLHNVQTNIVSLGAANLVAAGGGNLISTDGSTLINHQTGALVSGATYEFTNANLVAAGGGNMVAAGGGNMVAAGAGNLIGTDHATLVAMGANRLIGTDGASLVAAGGGNLLSSSVGNLVAGNGFAMLARNMAEAVGSKPPGILVTGGVMFKDGVSATQAALALGSKGVTIFAKGAAVQQNASVIARDGASMVAAGSLNLIGTDHATLIGTDHATLIGTDHATLIGTDHATLVGNDGASFLPKR